MALDRGSLGPGRARPIAGQYLLASIVTVVRFLAGDVPNEMVVLFRNMPGLALVAP
jgi:hypothetical protein